LYQFIYRLITTISCLFPNSVFIFFLPSADITGLSFRIQFTHFSMAANKQAPMFGLVCECGLGKSVWIERIRWLSEAVLPRFPFQVMPVFVWPSDFWQTKCQDHSPHTIHAENLWKPGPWGLASEPSIRFVFGSVRLPAPKKIICIFGVVFLVQQTGLTIIATPTLPKTQPAAGTLLSLYKFARIFDERWRVCCYFGRYPQANVCNLILKTKLHI